MRTRDETASLQSEQPLVSAMMPARNVAGVVVDTIRSIQAQTYENWEIVFVDDGSTDSTVKVVQALADSDPRIRVFSLPFGGRGRARNACIERSRGTLIAVCDADDISFPLRFEKQVQFLQRHQTIGVVGSWWVPFVASIPPKDCARVCRFPTEPSELRRCFGRRKMRLHNATAMIRSSLFAQFGGYHPEQLRAQDYEFFARLSRSGVQMAAIAEPLLYYRQANFIPSTAYFHENGMFMAYADHVLAGHKDSFEAFQSSLAGRLWSKYYRIKYGYVYGKLKLQQLTYRAVE